MPLIKSDTQAALNYLRKKVGRAGLLFVCFRMVFEMLAYVAIGAQCNQVVIGAIAVVAVFVVNFKNIGVFVVANLAAQFAVAFYGYRVSANDVTTDRCERPREHSGALTAAKSLRFLHSARIVDGPPLQSLAAQGAWDIKATGRGTKTSITRAMEAITNKLLAARLANLGDFTRQDAAFSGAVYFPSALSVVTSAKGRLAEWATVRHGGMILHASY